MPSPRQIGVCSWSLQAMDPAQLVERTRACALNALQIALDPLRTGAWPLDDTRARLADSGIALLSGMIAMEGEDYTTLASIRETGGIRPDETWARNLEAATHGAALATELGLDLVTFHAGFIPHDPVHPERHILMDRLGQLADLFHRRGLRLALETGQETAATLLEVLRELDHPAVGVNFDPANMILYGMGDPIDALRALGPFVQQCHVKDALAAPEPGAWGTEVTAGQGSVRWAAFLATLDEVAPGVNLVIEREAGEQRAADVRHAARLLASLGVTP